MNDNRIFAFSLVSDDLGSSPHVNATATRAIGRQYARAAIDNGTGGEVRAGDALHQAINTDVGVIEQSNTTCHNFLQVVGGNVGGHTHSNTGGTIDQ